jgi:hypothetical protein
VLCAQSDGPTSVDFDSLLMHFKGLQSRHTAEIELRRTNDQQSAEDPSGSSFSPGDKAFSLPRLVSDVGTAAMGRVISEPINEWGW